MLEIGVEDLYQVESEEMIGTGSPRMPGGGLMPPRTDGFGLPPPATKFKKQKPDKKGKKVREK